MSPSSPSNENARPTPNFDPMIRNDQQPNQPLDATPTTASARLLECHPAPAYAVRWSDGKMVVDWANAIARSLGNPSAALEAFDVDEHVRTEMTDALSEGRACCLRDAANREVRVELVRQPGSEDAAWLLMIERDRGPAAGDIKAGLSGGAGGTMELLVAALDVMPAEVALLDNSGRIMAVNKAWREFARLNGLESDDACIGSNYLEACDQADGEAAIEANAVASGLRSVLAGQKSATYVEYPCDSPDEQRWFQVRASGFEWSGTRYAVVAHESLTESKRAEQQHRQQLDEMTHQWQKNSLGELASGIAHELNQPLGAITNYMNGCLRRLEAGTIDREQLIKTVRGCAELAEFAGGIIKRMRGFASTTSCQYQPMSLNDSVRQAIKFFKASPDSAKVRLRAELAQDLPIVRADEVQIQQVALNLLRNARDAVLAAGCSPAIVRVRTYVDDENMVCLAVSDNGKGLPNGVEGRLFEPFFSTKSKGMGLGLSISKTIAEVHGGRLTACNAKGEGALFELRLPAHQRAAGINGDRTAERGDSLAQHSSRSKNQGGVA